jgi:uncharacterized repeat protein (TIGR01451 family)
VGGKLAIRAWRAAIAALALITVGAESAAAHHAAVASELITEAVSEPCDPADPPDPRPIQPDRVVIGEFGTELEGSYVLIPFDVPAGTSAVRVKYCYDPPDAPTSSQIKHVLDLGLYDALGSDGLYDNDEFRGWGGSSHPDVTVSPEGFSTEQQYTTHPKRNVPGKTTRGFKPGPIPPGRWAVELGVAAVASQLEGDADGRVPWRVEIELYEDAAFADQPYVPAAYDQTPARQGAGWYAGDFHVHAEHSSLGDATMRETFDYAFAPLAADCAGCPPGSTGAGLDFITLSDYVTDSAWGEIGRYQADYSGKQIIRSSEVITYRGHTNNHASATYADYRTGAVYEWQEDGTLVLQRGPRPASVIFDAVHAASGFTQINHPTIFPSQVPGFDFVCRGCSWDYTDTETDYSKVDAIEIATGPAGLKQDPEPGPNPFTPTAIKFWEDAIDADGLNSNHIAAVGSSDSHKAGRANDFPNIPSSPIGQATTVVYADELSEKGIQRGVEAGHSYVKVFGNDGPDLRFEAGVPGSAARAIMGDTVHADSVNFKAEVLELNRARAVRPGNYELFVLKDGAPFLSAPIPPPTGDPAADDRFEFEFPGLLPGRYRLQVQRDSAIEAVSSPIYLEPAAPADLSLAKSDSPDPVFAGQTLSYRLNVRNDGPSNAAGVTVTDELPADVSFDSAAPSQGSCSESGRTVRCGLGALATGASATIAIRVTPRAEGTLTNTATVEAIEGDPNPSNNAASASTTVNPAADLQLTKTDSPDPAHVGKALTYTLNVKNNGGSNASGVILNDQLPKATGFGSVSTSQGTCTRTKTSVTCNLRSLASGATATVTIVVKPTKKGTITNTASATATQPSDPNTANNTATATTTVVP